ncbi:MAG TPA: hypothetical protein VML55_09575 [Planctomycetaceae bacterium]|nr:hypothetical protein [Planctomycetaceae bacterium]
MGVVGVAAAMLQAAAATAVAEQPRVSRVSVVVGSRFADEGGAAEAAAAVSPLRSPFGVDFDRGGTMFVVELEGGRVHERRADGALAVVAGDGSKSYKGDGGPAAGATFNGMHNVAISRAGKAYIADTWNHCVREIDLETREIRTLAGTGTAGFSGDGGPAERAEFNYVMCVTLNAAEDTLFIADINNRRIRALDLGGKTGGKTDTATVLVRTVAGNGEKGVPRDGAAAVDSPLVDPRAVAPDSRGRVYVLERSGHALRVVEGDGAIRTVAGTGTQGFGDGVAREARFAGPKHLCVDELDRVYVADDVNGAIRCYDPRTETVATILGRGQGAAKMRLKHPHGVCWQGGSLYVVDTGHDRVLRVEFAE